MSLSLYTAGAQARASEDHVTKSYRIAIIGIGAISDVHARAIGDLDNLELVAGCCRGEEKGRKFAADFDCSWFADYEQMLDQTRPDLVTIATPSGAHLEPTQACASRGIHVLCEKPLEITTKRVDRMIEVADGAGIKLGGIFPQRFNPVVQLLHQAVGEGRFGNLAAVSTYVPWWRDDAYYAPDRWQGTQALDGGGALMNQSIHGVDAIQWIAGAAMQQSDSASGPVEEVFAFTSKRGHDPDLIEVEDTAVAVLRFRNGALGQILGATSMFPGSLKRIQVAGRDGTAEVLEDQLITWAFRQQNDDDESIRREFSGEGGSEGGAGDPMSIDYSLHMRNIAAFVDALENDKTFFLSGPESRRAVAVVEAIYESARTARPVSLK